MNQEELEDIRADIYAEPWKDPQLFPDLLHRAITELGAVAIAEPPGLGYRSVDARMWAEQLLRSMQGRARSGVPFDEPAYGDLGPTNPKDV